MRTVLNEQPNVYTLMTIGKVKPLGVREAIKQLYAQVYASMKDFGTYTINVHGNDLSISRECLAMHKAILFAGCCKFEERAISCKIVFDTCLLAKTVDEYKECIGKLDMNNQWFSEIAAAVNEVWS